MKQYKIFIDGESGTTGLQIRSRLKNHPDIEIVSVDYEKRRDIDAKRRLMQSVDVTVLCLPDDAAKESAALAVDAGCRVLDASSAHRTADGWVFGMPVSRSAHSDSRCRQSIQSWLLCHRSDSVAAPIDRRWIARRQCRLSYYGCLGLYRGWRKIN